LALIFFSACSSQVELGAMMPGSTGEDGSVADARASDASAPDASTVDASIGSDADAATADMSADSNGTVNRDAARDTTNESVPPDVNRDRDQDDAEAARADADAAVIDVPMDRPLPDDTRADGPLDYLCPFSAPDPIACVTSPGGGLPPTTRVDCPRNYRVVVQTSYPSPIKTDAQGIYWSADGTRIYWLPTGTTGYRHIAQVQTANYHGFWLDDDAVYFDDETDGGSFVTTRILRDGTGRTPIVTTKFGTQMLGTDRIYFKDDVSGRLASVPKMSGPVELTPITNEFVTILQDDAYIYWLDGGDDWLKRVAVGGSTIEPMAQHPGRPFRIIQDQTHLYWLEGDDTYITAVKRIAKNGATVELLASNVGQVSQFSEQGDGLLMIIDARIAEIPKTGGCARLLAAPPLKYTIDALTADGESIYWKSTDRTIEVQRLTLWRAPRSGGVAAYLVSPLGSEGFSSGNPAIHMTPTQVFWTTETGIQVMDRR
jgi:hypothetical protein